MMYLHCERAMIMIHEKPKFYKSKVNTVNKFTQKKNKKIELIFFFNNCTPLQGYAPAYTLLRK